MLARDRKQLISGLGTSDRELPWASKSCVAVAACFYVIFIFFAMPIAAFQFGKNSNLFGLFTLLAPLPFSFLVWLLVRAKNVNKRIRFNEDRFEFEDQGRVYFAGNWDEIEWISKFRLTLTICKSDGSVGRVLMPDAGACRDKSHFDAIIGTYISPVSAKARLVKTAKTCLVLGCVGVISLVLMGKPKIMSTDNEFPITRADYWHMAGFCLGIIFAFFIFIGIFTYLDYLSSGRVVLAVEPASPENFSEFDRRVERDFGWILPVELLVGKSYRYFDPERLYMDAKAQITAMWCFFVFVVIGTGFAAMMFIFQKGDVGIKVIGVLITTGLGVSAILPLRYIARLNRNKRSLEDIVELSKEGLKVTRSGNVRAYPSSPKNHGGEQIALQTKLAPFDRYDQFGIGSNAYQLDRRFLVEVRENEGQER